jgi:hypothetical protein
MLGTELNLHFNYNSFILLLMYSRIQCKIMYRSGALTQYVLGGMKEINAKTSITVIRVQE